MVVADPWADPKEVEQSYGITLSEINESQQVDSLIVAVGHDEYRNLDAKELKSICKGSTPVLADVKCLYDRNKLTEHGFTVFRL